jgi:hypothetical protein
VLLLFTGLELVTVLGASSYGTGASTEDDRQAVAALGTEYQTAVKENDPATMDRILADDFVLVTGSGKTYARRGDVYERNDELVRAVRVCGDAAVVTARLWEKYTSKGQSHDHTFWFSDTYVRTGNWMEIRFRPITFASS